MKIRLKIILVVLPVVVLALCVAQEASFLAAQSGLMRLAQSCFLFKNTVLKKYLQGPVKQLVENKISLRPAKVEAAKMSLLL
jgi:hypothetical protein